MLHDFKYQASYLFNKNVSWALRIQTRSTRFETERWESPIEGFVFRIWFWNNPLDTFTYGKSLLDIEPSSTSSKPTKSSSLVTQIPTSTTNDKLEMSSFKTLDNDSNIAFEPSLDHQFRDTPRYLNLTEKIFYATLHFTNPEVVRGEVIFLIKEFKAELLLNSILSCKFSR